MGFSTSFSRAASIKEMDHNDWLSTEGTYILSKESSTFDSIAESRLTNVIGSIPRSPKGKLGFNALLDRMLGIFPSDLVTLLERQQVNYFADVEKEAPNSCRSVQGWHELAKQAAIPPPHAASYEWRFTEASAKAIVDYVLSDTKKPSARICCLGTPTVALEFVRRGIESHEIYLLDINDPVVNCINRTFNTDGIVAIRYDVQRPVPRILRGQFDIVIIDPPWYLDYYKLFFSRSISLLADEGGVILCPVFEPLARHNASSDLRSLKADLELMQCEELKRIFEIRFESPNFEIATLSRLASVPSVRLDWRKADLYEMRFGKSKASLVNTRFRVEQRSWSRLGFDNASFALSAKAYKLLEIKSLMMEGSDILLPTLDTLLTISRRELANREIDLWDSENQIFTV